MSHTFSCWCTARVGGTVLVLKRLTPYAILAVGVPRCAGFGRWACDSALGCHSSAAFAACLRSGAARSSGCLLRLGALHHLGGGQPWRGYFTFVVDYLLINLMPSSPDTSPEFGEERRAAGPAVEQDGDLRLSQSLLMDQTVNSLGVLVQLRELPGSAVLRTKMAGQGPALRSQTSPPPTCPRRGRSTTSMPTVGTSSISWASGVLMVPLPSPCWRSWGVADG